MATVKDRVCGMEIDPATAADMAKAMEVTLEIIDDDGQTTTGQFIFRDARGRVYPLRTRRLAPDFFFHDQIYRHSGETIALPEPLFPGFVDRPEVANTLYDLFQKEYGVLVMRTEDRLSAAAADR